MAEDERLREALIELEELRRREAALAHEARALVDVLSGLKRAQTEAVALETLRRASAAAVDGQAAFILGAGPPVHILCSDLAPDLAPGDLPVFGKARNLADLARAPAWAALAQAGWCSALSAPLGVQGGGAIVVLHRGRAAFSTLQRALLVRIADLAGSTLQALALQARAQLLAAVIEGAPVGVAIADARRADRPLIFVNHAYEALTGQSAAQAIGKPAVLDAPARRAAATEQTGTFEQRADPGAEGGDPTWTEVRVFPVSGPGGASDYVVTTHTDISARIAAQAESELSRQRMADALGHTDAGFVLLNAAGNIRFSNPRFAALLPSGAASWARGTGFAQNWAAYLASFPEEVLTAHADIAGLSAVRLTAPGAREEVTLPDGRTLLMRAQDTSEGGVVVSATDITPQKSVERTLRARVAAMEQAPDGIGVADSDGRIIFANPALARLAGAPRTAALLGRTWRAPYGDGADAARLDAEAARTGLARGQLSLTGPDGTLRRHDVALRAVDHVGLIVIIRDVTEARAEEAKRAELEEQLGTARRQQIVSQMAAGLAHDFGNLLSAINGSALLIGGDQSVPAPARAHADRITAAGNQAAWLVNRLLDLGRDNTAQAPFDLRQAVRSALDLLSVGLQPGVDLHSEIAQVPMILTGSPTEVTQIALNVMLNAQDALEGQGRIRVWLGEVTVDAQNAPQVGRLSAGRRYAELGVHDDGTGIAPDVLAKMFEPYVSTKGDRGTGLGLATVASMVQSAGGAILVTTELGEGTRFSIYWPLEGSAAPAEAEAAPDLTGALILVVDDERDVAEVIAAYLEGLGAEVATATDPELAIEAIIEDPDAWSAVVTDYNMGALTGGDVIEAVMASAPELPVFIVTALSRRMADPRISASCVAGVFAKPPDLRQISSAIETARTDKEQTK
ncbi:MAG: PAS domain-containing protein [Pseudomonadota bacterium]